MNPIPHVITDGGKLASGILERKDCTVRALAIASGVPYLYAHQLFSKLGRKQGRGFRFVKVATHLGMKEYPQPKHAGRMRVRTAIRRYAKGRFVFRVCGHVFAVVDGVAHDTCSARALANCVVTNIWEVNPSVVQPQLALAPALSSANEI